jgi:hypothetical protein
MYTSSVLLNDEPATAFLDAFGSISDSMTDWSGKIIKDFSHIVESFRRKSEGYQIKHIFLIDRESGIQIEGVSAKEAGILNGDAISAMFSAIQSFVQDAFCRDQSSKLTDFRVGDHSIWVAHGPQLMLACVVVGEVPKALKNDLDQILETIQSEYIDSLSDLGERECVVGLSCLMNTLITAQKSMTLAGNS